MAEHPTQHPKKSASFLSLVFLSWMNKLFYLGRKRPLTGRDLYFLLEEDKTRRIINDIESFWRSEELSSTRNGRHPRLWKALSNTFSFKLKFFIISLRFLSTFSSLSLAILVWHLLKLLSKGSHIEYRSAVLFISGITAAGFIKSFSEQHFKHQSKMKGMRLKVALIGLVYKKSILASHSDLSKFTTGHILNLVSNDAQRMEEAVNSLVMAMNAPIEIAATIALLWIYIGWQALSGVIFFVVLLIYNLLASREFSKLRFKVASFTDKRLGVLNNIICGIRAVKMYAWEWSFYDVVKRLRSMEMKHIRKRFLIVSSFVASYNTATPTASLISVITLLYAGIPLSSFSIFTLLILLNIARFALTVGLSTVLRYVIDGYVALKRIEHFLTSLPDSTKDILEDQANAFVNKSVFLENIDMELHNRVRMTYGKALPKILRVESWRKSKPVLLTTRLLEANNQENSAPVHLKIENVSVCWGGVQNGCVLQGISFSALAGKLVMIGGAVGSGKSSLLMAILREIPLKNGIISGYGKIAYVSQIPWIFSGTIRENILFGKPFHREKFHKVVDVCDLWTDFNQFPKGDLSLIGQRGVSLSGGQRARVSLARALYSDADIFLLDDPLSAVDAKVGKKIFQECICGMLKEKLRILVTHQLQYLRRADEIVLLKDGKIDYKGPFYRLQNIHPLVDNYELDLDDELHGEKQKGERNLRPRAAFGLTESAKVAQDMTDDDEDSAEGSVTWRTYWSFFRAGLPAIIVVLLVLLSLIGQVALVAPNWWLSKMAEMTNEQQKSLSVLGVFGGLIATAITLAVTRVFVFIFLIIRSSEHLHNKMTEAILKCPVLFMDRNPVGRIMNRFSKDTGAVDELLPQQFAWMVTLNLNFAGVMVLAAFVNFWMVVAVVPIVVVFALVCWFSLKTSRELKRLEAVRCSPMYAHVADTINGLVVIRSSNRQRDFLEQFIRYQDEHTKAFHLVISSKQWLGLHLDLLCVVFITCVGFGSLLVTQDAALTGLVITYAIEIIGETWFGISMYSEVENQMTSAERVMAYTKLSSEPGYSRKSKPPSNWPSVGALSIRGLSFAYYDGGPRVLEDVQVDILPQQKIGIAGRTGAGKSSLIAALFRMPDPRGQILIDGVDLGTLDIQAARRAMAVITQDPVLFATSIRKNLDPFDKFDSQAIWTALEDVQLKTKIRDLKEGLDFTLGESGISLSVGEKQLLCLARALLQRCKILIMDEATANVDFKTDNLIQQVIRVKFRDCTVLTIAHRINTIMDYDKVLVLDQGHVVEFDAPRVLAGKKNGVFARLVRNHSNKSNEND